MALKIMVRPHEWTLTYGEMTEKIAALAQAGIIYFSVENIGESEESRLSRLLTEARHERDRALKEVKALKSPPKRKKAKKK